MAAVRQAVAATAQPAAVRGQTRYWELADAGHWVSVWFWVLTEQLFDTLAFSLLGGLSNVWSRHMHASSSGVHRSAQSPVIVLRPLSRWDPAYTCCKLARIGASHPSSPLCVQLGSQQWLAPSLVHRPVC